MLLLIAFFATTAPLATTADNVTCPDGFKDLSLEDDRCYRFSSDNTSDVHSWTPAFVMCQNMGGDILSVVDPLHFYPMAELTRRGGLNAWTGLLNIGGMRSWADETPFNPELEQFVADNTSSELYGYISADDGLFHFAGPLEVMTYICYVDVSSPEPPTPAPTVTPACPVDWEENTDDGNCYLFSEDEQYWSAADLSCFQEGANLVSIHDKGLLTFLLVKAGDDLFWTGLQNKDDVFVWADGTATDDIGLVTPYMDEWKAENEKNCVALKAETYPTSLVHEDCFTMHKYVCYKEALNP